MNGLDYALLGLVGLSALLGFWRGLISEIVALGAWVLAFLVARAFLTDVTPWVSAWVREPVLQAPVAFVVIFVGVLVVVALLRWLLRELVQAAGLGLADRFLGACFGLVRGGVIVFAVAMLVGLAGLAREAWWREASLSAPLETAVLASRPWLPDPLTKRLRFR